MARTREFDERAVLARAMQLFRRRQYDAVSIRDLEEETGLKAGSIYNSFGDKAGLFDAAFAHYNEVVLRGRIARYAPPGAGLAGLRVLFLSLLREPRGESFGCLITNSAVEFGGDSTAHPQVVEALLILSQTFLERLKAARRAGELCAGVDATTTAEKLLALYHGILVLVRARRDKRALERMINHEFDALEVPDDA